MAHEEKDTKVERDQQKTEGLREKRTSSVATALPAWERELLAATVIDWLDATLVSEDESADDE